jgi:restriction system protein
MPLPTYERFIEPILRHLSRHPEGVAARDVHDAAAAALSLTDEERAERLPSGGQLTYKNRAGWAHDRLKRAGLSSSPRRGYWQLTAAGQRFEAEHPTALTPEVMEDAFGDPNRIRLRAATPLTALGAGMESEVTLPPESTLTPEERLNSALKEIRTALAADLLETIGRASPTFFEGLVLTLLHALGYGATPDDLKRVGGSGDGGIDGIISLDRLGLEKVYVQAKRWQNQVSRPDIQGFYGALAGQRARKGVFITTSSFSQPAIDFAKSVEGIVLVDGPLLTELMMDHEVGVSHRVVKLPTIDSDFFDE